MECMEWRARVGQLSIKGSPLISNYLIKICLRRGAAYAFPLFLRFLLVSRNTHGGDRVFKGSKVDLTSRRRCEGPRKEKNRARSAYQVPNLGYLIERRPRIHVNIYICEKILFNVIANLFTIKKRKKTI